MIFFVIFGIMLLLWVRVIQNVLAERTTSSTAAVVQRIHYMMLVLLVRKLPCLLLLCNVHVCIYISIHCLLIKEQSND